MQSGPTRKNGSKNAMRVVLVVGGLVTAAGSSWAVKAGGGTAGAADLAETANEARAVLGLEDVAVFTWQRDTTAAAAATQLTVPIGGQDYVLNLAPQSVRAAGFELLVQRADGSLVNVQPGPVRTLRGTVGGVDGSAVAASLLEDGLYARILWPDDSAHWIEPIAGRVAGAAPGHHAVYRSDDVIPSLGACTVLHPPLEAVADDLKQGGVAGTGLFFAELAIDADNEYFRRYGTVEATEAQIETVINGMNVQYERDVQIRHEITRIIVRSEGNPSRYDTNLADQLLFGFKGEWRAEHQNVDRDVAQLFTGKNLAGGTIGIAWLGSICSTSFGYSVVESNCTVCGSFACKTDLSAHELAHSWGADHCGGSDCSPPCREYTMNCSLQCQNLFHPTETIPDILLYRDSRTCLDVSDELSGVIISADADNVLEGDTLQLTATADFRFGDDQDVTTEATWSLDRPEVGSMSSGGLFAAFEVDGDSCVTVSATYTFDSTTRTGFKTIIVMDADAPLAVVASAPENEAIDARQPSDPNGSDPAGWRSFDLTFNGETCLASPSDFFVSQEGGTPDPLGIAGFQRLVPDGVRILLNRIIDPAAWTTVTHDPTGESVRVGFLPGDANANGTSDSDDILAVIEHLNEQADPPFAIWQCDIDRSDSCGPADILRIVDLLNGAETYEIWNGRTLP